MKPGPTLATTGVTPPEIHDAPTLPSDPVATPWPPPSQVGRFTISSLLGTGGMGEVYAARDPELDRLVAIKLLRPDLPKRADIRLRREARAMAKLSHPNLVTVHEVGVHAGQLFVAMELIDGETLHSWVHDRPWREIVRAYIAAGRGLAAAHAAGIVHRDFKPDNVLVSHDGRVAVGDFGLARQSDDISDSGSGTTTDDRVTQEGALVGTLRYMAPEQLARMRADVRSDQFAFCVALWEALDGHPFDRLETQSSSTADARREAIEAGLIRRRLRGGVPSPISRALARGLAPEPKDRWPSMTKLLDALDRALHRSRRFAIAGVVSALGVGLVVMTLLAWSAGSTHPPDDPCAKTAQRINAVWQPGPGLDRIKAAFETVSRADGGPALASVDEAATRTAAELDRYARAWTSMTYDSCEANTRGDQLRDVYSRRAVCLDRRLYELQETVERLTSNPTASVVERSIPAVSRLRAIADCGNVEGLLDRPPPPADPAKRDRIDKLGVELVRLHARSNLGVSAPDAALETNEREAVALGDDDLIGEAKYMVGHAAYARGDADVAVAKMRESALAFTRVHDDTQAARALSLAAESLVDAGRANDALEVDRAAELAAARGGDRPQVRADVLDSLGSIYVALGQFDDADKTYAEAIRLLESSHANPLDLAQVLNAWANALNERSDYARSLPLSNRAVSIIREHEGNHNPELARALHSNANELVQIGRYMDAQKEYEEALSIKREFYGPKESTVAMTLHAMSNAAEEMGDHDKAAELVQQAFDIWLAKKGLDHQLTQMARYSMAQNLRHRGKLPEALAMIQDVLARRRAMKPPPQPKIANALDEMASTYEAMHELPKALDAEQEALAIREKVLGPNTGDVALSLIKLAEIEVEANDCTKVIDFAKRAVAVIATLPAGDADSAAAPIIAVAECDARRGKRDDAIDGYNRGIASLLKATAAADIELRERAKAELAKLTSH